jgi:hypothetical protein
MSASEDPLGPQVRRLFEALAHAGEPPVAVAGADATPAGATRVVSGEAGREQRGTRVRFTLSLAAGDRLLEVRYRAYGCPYTLAACEWLARRLEAGGWHLVGAPADWAQELRIPPARMGRLLVVEDALRAALAAAQLTGTDS